MVVKWAIDTPPQIGITLKLKSHKFNPMLMYNAQLVKPFIVI